MALSIGVHVGSRIKVGQKVLTVHEIIRPDAVSVSVDDGPQFILSDQYSTEIAPEVRVFCGMARNSEHQASRLAFEAPRSVKINRIEDVSTVQ
jgi:hypothetical protein